MQHILSGCVCVAKGGGGGGGGVGVGEIIGRELGEGLCVLKTIDRGEFPL